MTRYKIKVRQTREWFVYVETSGDVEDAEELACDILEEDLGDPTYEDVDAEVQRGPVGEIPEGAPTFPRGLR